MNESKNLVTLVTAIISATALLVGYSYQKSLEKETEIRKTRQEIYSRLLTSITKRNEILGRVIMTSKYRTAKNSDEQNQVIVNNAELSKNWNDRTEIVAFLCLYGTDDAIEAYSDWTKEDLDRSKGGNLGQLVVALRKAIYPKTLSTPDQANLVIWQDDRYLKKPSKQ